MDPFLVGEIDEHTHTPNPEHIKTIILRVFQQIRSRQNEGKLMKVRDDTGREVNCVLRFDPSSQRYFDDEI